MKPAIESLAKPVTESGRAWPRLDPVSPMSQSSPLPTIAIDDSPLDPARVQALVGSTAAGGQVVFVGTVRAENRGREVIRLHYEAYEPMASKVLAKIAGEAQAQGALAVAVHHRTGDLSPGEVAVIVAVAAPHRDAAFAACRYVIDQLKARAPIWKKEIYHDGESWLSHTP
jgi:molybdopterin synthase catalytic subunit